MQLKSNAFKSIQYIYFFYLFINWVSLNAQPLQKLNLERTQDVDTLAVEYCVRRVKKRKKSFEGKCCKVIVTIFEITLSCGHVLEMSSC